MRGTSPGCMPTRILTLTTSDRLDRALAAVLPELSRSAIQRLIDQGRVRVNGAPRQASARVLPGDQVWIDLPDPEPDLPQPERLPLAVLYEDACVAVIDKPAGMATHPAAGKRSGTVVNALLARFPQLAAVGDPWRPGIVHRLDKETSGVLIVAKTVEALSALQGQFKARTVHKTYLALCVGWVQPESGVIRRPIARDPRHRQRMAVIAGGRAAATQFGVIETYALDDSQYRYTLLRAHPLTGRTHQIRVHLAALGFPIVGDATYGSRKDLLTRRFAPRHLLHAAAIEFVSPATGETVRVEAPLPADMHAALEQLRRAK